MAATAGTHMRYKSGKESAFVEMPRTKAWEIAAMSKY